MARCKHIPQLEMMLDDLLREIRLIADLLSRDERA